MKFGFHTLGCKVNQFETQALEQIVLSDGHTIVDDNADIFIINSCTVTSSSDKKNIRAINKIKKENPNSIIAVCGCLSQTNPEILQPLVDVLCGTDNRANVIPLSIEAFSKKQHISTVKAIEKTEFELLPAGILRGRTRALLKIQDGCDHFCTYCIIPYARGRVKSMPIDFAISQAKKLENSGEIIITGIEISSYGKDISSNIITLIENICTTVPKTRIRLGSLEPRTITHDFCKRLSVFDNFCAHFHLSMQSGCDAILKSMNRKYTAQAFYNATEILREYFPSCSITTDLIVGFPDETDENFIETTEFIQKCNFASMHIFPFSIREGTPAATMPNQVPTSIKTDRAFKANIIAQDMQSKFLSSFIGRKMTILCEQTIDGFCFGHSDKHFMVKFACDDDLKNKLIDVEIKELCGDELLAERIIN